MIDKPTCSAPAPFAALSAGKTQHKEQHVIDKSRCAPYLRIEVPIWGSSEKSPTELVKIHQSGMQWKQGVVVYILL